MYTSLSMVSAMVLGAIAGCGWIMGLGMILIGVGLWILGGKNGKLLIKILAAISFVLGILLGGVSGYFGGIVDNIIQRIIEVLSSKSDRRDL